MGGFFQELTKFDSHLHACTGSQTSVFLRTLLLGGDFFKREKQNHAYGATHQHLGC